MVSGARQRAVRFAFACALAALLPTATAHDFRVGDLRIDHPYALPTPVGATTGAVYFRGIRNEGRQPDRLLGASTPRAESVQLRRAVKDGGAVRMDPLDALEIAPGAQLRLRHDGDVHLTLVGLRAPLKDGERFALTLRFERAGVREVVVWVQKPRVSGVSGHRH